MKKITIKEVLKKKNKQPITCLTAYSKTTAKIVDKHCDIILVGDSVGMVLYGMKTTKEMDINTMILHAKTVKSFAKRSLVVFDMPYKTYPNKNIAYRNAKKVIKLTKCDAIKLEGGKEIVNIVKYLIAKRIPVMGHIGLLPQSSKKFIFKGKNLLQRKKILKDAKELSNAGVFAIVIECVIENLAKEITNSVPVPTIGIGASRYCDGQILVIDDMVGMSDFHPRFVKKYSNVSEIIEKGVKKYCKDVKSRKFPTSKHIYKF